MYNSSPPTHCKDSLSLSFPSSLLVSNGLMFDLSRREREQGKRRKRARGEGGDPRRFRQPGSVVVAVVRATAPSRARALPPWGALRSVVSSRVVAPPVVEGTMSSRLLLRSERPNPHHLPAAAPSRHLRPLLLLLRDAMRRKSQPDRSYRHHRQDVAATTTTTTTTASASSTRPRLGPNAPPSLAQPDSPRRSIRPCARNRPWSDSKKKKEWRRELVRAREGGWT